MRNDGRRSAGLRPTRLEQDYSRYAEGSCLIIQGQTAVLCNATVLGVAVRHLAMKRCVVMVGFIRVAGYRFAEYGTKTEWATASRGLQFQMQAECPNRRAPRNTKTS